MQNPPPNPGYGNEYGGATAPGANAKSAIGLDANVAAALGYPIGIIAIINLIMEKENKFVRFHAVQTLLLFVLWIVLFFVLMILTVALTIIGAIIAQGLGSGIAGLIINLVWIVLWLLVPFILLALMIFAAVKAFQGQMYKLPIIGNLAEKFTGK